MEINCLLPVDIPAYENPTNWQKKVLVLREHENKIVSLLSDIQSNFLLIACNLIEVESKQLYDTCHDSRGVYCRDVYRYAFIRFGISKTTSFNLISVAKKFTNKFGHLKPEYKGFGLSQLVELVSVPDALHKYFTPAMTVEKIRQVKAGESVSIAGTDGRGGVVKDYSIPTSELQKTALAEQKADVDKSDPAKTVQAEPVFVECEKPAPVVIEAQAVKQGSNIITFKNNEQREKFLTTYESWSLLLDIPLLRLKVRRVYLSNGAFILAYVWLYKDCSKKDCTSCRLKLYEPGAELHFSSYFDMTDGQLIDYIRTNKLSALI